MASARRIANQYHQATLASRVASLWLKSMRLGEDSGAGSAAIQFFDSPERREVREFAESNAISNMPELAPLTDVDKAPPTPEEIDEMPGAEAVSTLNRYLVQTEEPVPSSVPQSHAELPKHPENIDL